MIKPVTFCTYKRKHNEPNLSLPYAEPWKTSYALSKQTNTLYPNGYHVILASAKVKVERLKMTATALSLSYNQ